ncbi:putative GrpE nucleotide exchange factor [Helianthus annuus]|nr:putative GrpE nucleotide exchange factor [Helianthus annuus]KAJ0820536.1 putative GrpE nucleotide exchange factor [Helianthus annuus]
MRACAFVSQLWRKKQLNSNTMKAIQINNISRCYCCNGSPFKANQVVVNRASVFPNSFIGSSIHLCRLFSSASSLTNGNEANNAPQTALPDDKVDAGPTGVPQSVKRRRRGTKRITFSDSDSDSETDLSRDGLIKLLAKKEELLKKKHTEMVAVQDKAMMTFAENNNVIERTKREAENAKKFAIQSFAKSLLDVADNLGRASLAVKDRFMKIETAEDPTGALPLLKTLLEGVEMTEKQLVEVFKKFGVERYDPMNEQFDPNRHNAVFQVPDQSKPPNTVAAVMKPGYMLHERIIRPAEVGVVSNVAADNNETH